MNNQTSPISPMLKAFLEQSNINDSAADKRVEELELLQKNREQQAILQLSRSQKISEYMQIQSNVKESDINQKTQPHEQFKNYDHSLEKVRIKFKSKENSEDCEIGDVEEMMQNIFKD